VIIKNEMRLGTFIDIYLREEYVKCKQVSILSSTSGTCLSQKGREKCSLKEYT